MPSGIVILCNEAELTFFNKLFNCHSQMHSLIQKRCNNNPKAMINPATNQVTKSGLFVVKSFIIRNTSVIIDTQFCCDKNT